MGDIQPMATPPAIPADALLADLCTLITQSRERLSATVNAELTLLYWNVGDRLQREVLAGERAAYGQQLMERTGQRLSQEFGRGFEAKNLRRMVQFAQAFPHGEIVATLSRQLSWSHFVDILPLKTEAARHYYAQAAAAERWSVRELRAHIERKAFERSAIAQTHSGAVAATGAVLAPAQASQARPEVVFKDPYLLDFLGLRAGYLEADVESAILRELESFILEMGRGFAFVERQKRMVIDGEDHYLDLLFFHRRLRRLVAVELKLGAFRAADKGQMELYLAWLERHERQPGEERPIGLILCADASREKVELLRPERDGITVAEYWTELPPREVLEQRLHQALQDARERLARREILLGDENV